MAFVLALFGLFYVPSLQVDLTRYFAQVDALRGVQGFGSVFYTLGISDRLQVSSKFLFYLVSRFSYDNLLPFVVVMLVACIGLYLIKDYTAAHDFAKPTQVLMYVAFLLLMPWGTVITNIRYITGLAFMVLALYRDLYQQRNDPITWLMYILGCTMHLVIVLFLMARIGLAFFLGFLKTKDKKTRNFLLLALLLIMALFSQSSLFRLFMDKALFYLQGGSEGSTVQTWFQMADNSVGRRLGKYAEELFTLSQAVLIIPAIWRTHIDKDTPHNNIYWYTFGVLVLTFLMTLMPGTTWVRFAFMVAFMSVFIISAEETYLKNVYLVLVNQSIWLGMLIWSVIWQVYQYTGSEIMTRNDYFNILYPLWRVLR